MKRANTKFGRAPMAFALTAVALVAVATVLASCGSTAGSGMSHGGSGMSGDGNPEMSSTDGMKNMGNMDGMGGMDMASMLTEDGGYSDERFVDLMIPHHEGAVAMARTALDGNAEHPEVEQLSQDIVRTQNSEIREFESIREQEFGSSQPSSDVSAEDMEMMRSMGDSGSLAEADPFDLAFIEEMIPHHESAIEMAEVARDDTDNPRIRSLAEEIIAAQEAEISEMQAWREEWYPEG